MYLETKKIWGYYSTQSPRSIFKKLAVRSRYGPRNAGAYLYGISPRSRTSPGDLNTRRRCPRGILELFRYGRERSISLSLFLSRSDNARAAQRRVHGDPDSSFSRRPHRRHRSWAATRKSVARATAPHPWPNFIVDFDLLTADASHPRRNYAKLIGLAFNPEYKRADASFVAISDTR